MGSAAQIPFSNPAGNNQMSPPTGGMGKPSPIMQGNIPGSPSAPGNPYMIGNNPATSGTTGIGASSVPGSPSATPQGIMPSGSPQAPQGTQGVPASGPQNSFITSGTDAGQNALSKQLDDIYGQGVGGSLFTLLNNMSGTNSAVLQEYIQSLIPQEATAQANTNAALGAGGVSANSSVAAIADSNLQSQEFSAIASESANLTQSQEQLTAQILSGTEGAAVSQVAASPLNVFGEVMSSLGQDASQAAGAYFKP
jgi:hypothetical protein